MYRLRKGMSRKINKTEPKKFRILFLYDLPSPWVVRDFEMLQRHFEVIPLQNMPRYHARESRWKIIRILDFCFAALFHVLKILKNVLTTDLVYGFFANECTAIAIFFSKIFRKKSVVVTGCRVVLTEPPDVIKQMGISLPLRYILGARFSAKFADLLLAMSKYGEKGVLERVKPKRIIQVNLGCDVNKFKPNGPKENIVITVGYVNRVNVIRKGFKTFVESAKYLPNVKFYLIGKHEDDSINDLKAIATPNVVFTGYLPDDELLLMYQRAKVFCLLSLQEGEAGGGVLGEAMACECIPVLSNRAPPLRETAGDLGFYVPYGDAKATAEAIKKALNADPKIGKMCRERVSKLHSMKKREEIVVREIKRLLKNEVI
ncbi:MAG: Glycosyltransferase involved in cell wall bisynthesis [Methanophagales archaeon]|nr:glycosyltransferase [Methanophagales archaeon]MCU4139984.1 Glycosyltransferase involved in cell wall bisynthesis [Methanophagales archaeon]